MVRDSSNIKDLNKNQKVNYIKNLFFNCEINEVLDILLKQEDKNLSLIKIILEVLKDEVIINRIKEQCNITDNSKTISFVYSKILSLLYFYQKKLIMIKFFKLLNEEEKKNLAYYEYQNKTNVSFSSKTFNRYFSKYKEEALKQGELSNEEVLLLDDEIKKYNSISKNNKIWIIIILIILLSSIILYESILLKKYDGLFYPGIYFNDINLSGKKISEIDDIVKQENDNILNGKIVVSNINGNFDFSYKELGSTTKYDKVKDEIINYNNNLSLFEKIKMVNIKNKSKVFTLNAIYSDDLIDNFILLIKDKLNVSARKDALIVDDNHNVTYVESLNGFKLDEEKTKKEIENKLKKISNKIIINASGEVTKVESENKDLAVIDTKISSYTTNFDNVGNRGSNIVLAASKLNGTILRKNEEFSYYKTVGPYTSVNGYKSAPAYVNKVLSSATGGGVCQLATTLYNAQLRANLEIVYRINHSYAPAYVPKGLDATVYSSITDFKFKNQYDYPIYIVSYVDKNKLTVDIWSNSKTLGNKTYEPYSYYSDGGYVTYLKEFEDGNYIGQKYLNKSYYK